MEKIKEFIKEIPNFYDQSHLNKILYFGFYLENREQRNGFTIQDIQNCYTITANSRPKNFSDLFNKLLSSGRIVQNDDYYNVSGQEKIRIEVELGGKPLISIKEELRNLPTKFSGAKQKFVNEILGCLQVQAWRGAIVLTWILTMDHLQQLVLSNHLNTFNNIIQGIPLYKNLNVSKVEDFEQIKDYDFLQAVRTCGIIGSSQLGILETRLKERNRYAHPTNLEATDTITISYMEDLLYNIVLKLV